MPSPFRINIYNSYFSRLNSLASTAELTLPMVERIALCGLVSCEHSEHSRGADAHCAFNTLHIAQFTTQTLRTPDRLIFGIQESSDDAVC